MAARDSRRYHHSLSPCDIERLAPADGQRPVGFELVAVEVLPERHADIDAEVVPLECAGCAEEVDAEEAERVGKCRR